MQLLFENSEETTDIDGKVDGLFLKGRVLQFSKKKRKMNIGWCLIKSSKKFTLTKEIHEKIKFFILYMDTIANLKII